MLKRDMQVFLTLSLSQVIGGDGKHGGPTHSTTYDIKQAYASLPKIISDTHPKSSVPIVTIALVHYISRGSRQGFHWGYLLKTSILCLDVMSQFNVFDDLMDISINRIQGKYMLEKKALRSLDNVLVPM